MKKSLTHTHTHTRTNTLQAVAALGTRRSYRHWFVTVVRARGGLSPEFFGYPAAHNLTWVQNVLTTQNTSASVPFNVVQVRCSTS